MPSKTEIAKIYETLLSIPGMNEKIKIDLRIPRKNVLFLSKIIERGLSSRETDDKSLGILENVSSETLQELILIYGEILEKAGLTEMNEKLKTFS
jgi:hypothetical protein